MRPLSPNIPHLPYQDRFFTELREAPDGFSVVAEHFGRGLMNMTAASLAAAAEAEGAAVAGGAM